MNMPTNKVALVTGAAKRLGAASATTLHQQGYDIIIHYHHSSQDADALAQRFNNTRKGSACALQADLNSPNEVILLAQRAIAFKNRMDLLVNNASSFYPTPIQDAKESDWHDLFNTNAKAPYFLCQQLSEELKQQQGCIINMVDIHAQRPLPNHSLYTMAKSSLVTLTKALAKELAPDIRVNAVAPGAILWPDNITKERKAQIITEIPLQRLGTPEQIAKTVLFLAQADYITGQIIAVDGGRSL